MSSIIYFLLGLIFLLTGGDLLVKSSKTISIFLRIPTFIIGLSVVSFATSAPELFISVQAVLDKKFEIVFGNVIGSNIANICLVLATTLFFVKIKFDKRTKRIDIPFLLFSTLIFSVLLFVFNKISFSIGLFFMFIMIIYLWQLFKRKNQNVSIENTLINRNKMFLSIFLLVISIIFLKIGADWLIDGTSEIAKILGVGDRVVAFSLLALGTSLPELATSLVAVYKKENNLAVGNLIGSNIFNILVVLGITSFFGNIELIDMRLVAKDTIFMVASVILLCLVAYLPLLYEKNKISGFMLLSFYITFLYVAIWC